MLLPIDIDYLARQERIKDLIREAERVCLIRAIGHQYSSERKTYRRLVGWVGAQMIKVGQHLQGYGRTPPAKINSKIGRETPV